MKKQVLTLMALSIGFSVMAQNKMSTPLSVNIPAAKAVTSKKATMLGETAPFATQNQTVKPQLKKGGYAPGIFAATEAVVGQTDYDLQTNSSTYPRLTKHSDGTLSSVWTIIPDGGASAQRGTGYNYYDGSAWGPLPTARIEPTSRTGFVNLAVTASGQEMSFAHSSSAASVIYTYRPAKGTGAWTENTTALSGGGANSDTWARTAVGGSDGKTIHEIVNENNATTNQILYSRSTDDGATWNLVRSTIPGLDATAYPTGLGGDNYYIAANGTTVAVVIGDVTTDVALYKSNDNGDTWTKTQITSNFPNGYYNPDGNISDIDNDGVIDTVLTTGGDVNVVLDNSGTAHVFWGLMRILDDDATAGNTDISVFLGTNGIAYWNENATQAVIAAGAEDWNGNGVIDIPSVPGPTWTDPNELSWGRYGNMGLACIPAATVDANGTLYLAYQAIDENADTVGYYKAHYQVYVNTSVDGGNTWSTPYNVSTNSGNTDSAYFECVFPSIALTVDNNVYVEYQRDYAPGHSYQTGGADEINNAAASNINDIVVVSVPTTDVVGIKENTAVNASFTVSQNTPNPTHGLSTFNVNLKTTADVKVEVVNTVGQIVSSNNYQKLAAGSHTLNLDASQLQAGIYYYAVTVDGHKVTNKMIVK